MLKTLAFVLLFSSFNTFSADATRGEKLYKACIQCHGADGMGNVDEAAPKIAGQHDWYIVSSIQQFKAGVERKNPKMLPYIQGLSSADIEDLAAYISSMK